MTTNRHADIADVVGRLVDHLRGRTAPGPALAQVARTIDRCRAGEPPRSPLTLPRLDALASAAGGQVEPLGPLESELVASLAGTDPVVGAAVLGLVHEGLLDAGGRRRRGAFYTPVDVARRLVAEVFLRLPGPADGERVRVCDPALGGGVFLLAAAEELVDRGVAPMTVVERCLWGSDVDPLAVAVAEAALILWARGRGVDVGLVNVVCADPLEVGAAAWPGAPARGFDAVVGNPPFLNQLGAETSRPAEVASRLRDRWGAAVYRYTDTSAIFLLAATELVAPGGIVSMIIPVPVLVTADATRLRRELLDRCVPEHLWIARDDIFGVGVQVCAPVLRVERGRSELPIAEAEPGVELACALDEEDGEHGRARPARPATTLVTRTRGRSFEPLAARAIDLGALRAAGTWGELVADAFGVPAPATVAVGAGRLGDLCEATAGFRDQYYGLRGFVVEAAEGDPSALHPVVDAVARGRGRWPKLVTSGLIDPARMGWGTRPSRFDGRRWLAPVVDLDGLAATDPPLAAWAAARLVPKIVVAAQTRVLEAAVDEEGDWFPSVPTIAVVPEAGRLWDVAAVVLAPPTTAWAMNRHVGAALSADALRVSAKQLREAPLPADRAAWAEGVVHLRAAAASTDEHGWCGALAEFGDAMTLAYAAPREVWSWWLDRLPRWR